MLIRHDGKFWGVLSAGCLEQDVVRHAKQVIRTGYAKKLHYDLTSEMEPIIGFGNACESRIQILIEPCTSQYTWVQKVLAILSDNKPLVMKTKLSPKKIVVHSFHKIKKKLPTFVLFNEKTKTFTEVLSPVPKLLILGAGADAISLAKIFLDLEWEVIAWDDRKSLSKQSFWIKSSIPVLQFHHTQLGKKNKLIDFRKQCQGAYAVVMTHHFERDVALLQHFQDFEFPYLGLMGTEERSKKCFARLDPTYSKKNISTPVGLSIGAELPAEIAISIAAEILQLHKQNVRTTKI
jgi:xanthine/CO dehydrogenase XdhC/CoxF family maturation factor